MRHIVALVLVSSWLLALGCSSEPQKPPIQQPTYKDVRGDSDRFFEKQKQDEREHGDKMKESMP